jgi:hypothetical protein
MPSHSLLIYGKVHKLQHLCPLITSMLELRCSIRGLLLKPKELQIIEHVPFKRGLTFFKVVMVWVFWFFFFFFEILYFLRKGSHYIARLDPNSVAHIILLP